MMENPKLDRDENKKPVLVATDGRLMAIVPVETEKGDVHGSVPLKAIKELNKDKYNRSKLSLNGHAEVKHIDGTEIKFERDTESHFPNWQQVIPKKEKVFEIKLSAKRLLDLSQALGVGKYDAVTLTFTGELDAVKVDGIDGAFGLLMPMK